MEILPSEYQQLELYRSEKMFIRYAESCEDYGYVFLNTNPALIENEKQNIVISKDGVLILKFFDEFNDANMFPLVMGAYFESAWPKKNNGRNLPKQITRAFSSYNVHVHIV